MLCKITINIERAKQIHYFFAKFFFILPYGSAFLLTGIFNLYQTISVMLQNRIAYSQANTV